MVGSPIALSGAAGEGAAQIRFLQPDKQVMQAEKENQEFFI
jgi:hypothetical protein